MITDLKTKQGQIEARQTQAVGQLKIRRQSVEELLRLLNEFGSLSHTPEELENQQSRLKDRQRKLERMIIELEEMRDNQKRQMGLISELAAVVEEIRRRNEPAFEKADANLTKTCKWFDDDLNRFIGPLDQILTTV